MCGFDGVQKGSYFGRKSIRRVEEEARRVKVKSGKAAGKDEVTGERIKRGSSAIWPLRMV